MVLGALPNGVDIEHQTARIKQIAYEEPENALRSGIVKVMKNYGWRLYDDWVTTGLHIAPLDRRIASRQGSRRYRRWFPLISWHPVLGAQNLSPGTG